MGEYFEGSIKLSDEAERELFKRIDNMKAFHIDEDGDLTGDMTLAVSCISEIPTEMTRELHSFLDTNAAIGKKVVTRFLHNTAKGEQKDQLDGKITIVLKNVDLVPTPSSFYLKSVGNPITLPPFPFDQINSVDDLIKLFGA